MAEFTLARLAAAADPVDVLLPWLNRQPKSVRTVLWITRSPLLADDLRARLSIRNHQASLSTQVIDLQSLADRLLQTIDPMMKRFRPRHARLLAEEIARDKRTVSQGEAMRRAGTITELKRAGITEDRWPSPHRDWLNEWERARVTLGVLMPEDRLLRAGKEWTAGRRGNFDGVKSLVISDFDSFSAPETAFLDAIIGSVKSVAMTLAPSAPLPVWIGEHDEPERIDVDDVPAAELTRIHAPGLLGETRMVARQLREWLDGGIDPASIIITARQPQEIADQLATTLADYGIPLAGVDPPSLSRTPAVATLLRAWQLPIDDFPFVGVDEVLRSGWFKPGWDECVNDREMPAKAEALLRTLDRPRGRDAYLAAIEQRIVAPFKPLEDEAGDRPRRERIEALAAHCQAFVKRFFRMWDAIPEAASAEQWNQRLRSFAREWGSDLEQSVDWQRFCRELDQWAEADVPGLKRRRLTFAKYTEVITRIAEETAADRDPPAGRAVRLLSPDDARHAPCDVLVVMDLVEGRFPSTAAPASFLTDAERQSLESERLKTADSRLRDEKTLFHSLIARPRRHLVLSRPSVDERGQERLPSSLLVDWESMQGTLTPAIRRKMAIEGFAEGKACSATERRVQAARMLKRSPSLSFADNELSSALGSTLSRAKQMAEARFQQSVYGAFDGRLTHGPAIEAAVKRFAPERTISPSSLEKYVECPFRFWLESVLRLDVLEEPTSRIEVTRRGQAVHRAMARFHRAVRKGKEQANPCDDIANAAEEYGMRSGTPTGRMLWTLEGRRLQRSAAKYLGQWDDFREKWASFNAKPVPVKFEQPFGTPTTTAPASSIADEDLEAVAEPLVIEVDNITVKIGGTIDRIDAVELEGETGFWIIDYKTGRKQNYTATDIVHFSALQLPLYALAVERSVFKGRPARPLGLAYWMIGDGGAKTVMPPRGVTGWMTKPDFWPQFREQLENWVATLVSQIRQALFPLAPRSDECTAKCPFGPTCRISQSRNSGKRFALDVRDEGKEESET
ncbi:MAG: PD-(D/E)XK nuclease family protein [Gemmataceae bacterium]